LVWHTNNFQRLSNEAVVEGVLQYGDFDDVRKLMALLGKKNVARIFRAQIKRRRVNYSPMIRNYFTHYFKLQRGE
ncbi:MAG: hypothetical protein AAB932_02855, partial [Patescibacteria group bacterium]